MKLDVPWPDYVRLDDGTSIYLFHFLVIIIRVGAKTSGGSYQMDFHTLYIIGLGLGREDSAADHLNIERSAE